MKDPFLLYFRRAVQNIGFVVLIVGLVMLFVSQLPGIPFLQEKGIIKTLWDEIVLALLTAGIVVLTTEMRSRQEFISLMEQTIDRKLSKVYEALPLARLLDDLQRSSVPDEIKRISAQIYSKYIAELKPLPGGGFQLNYVSWALESNKIFLDALYQANCSGIEVRCTHTSSIKIWLDFEEARTTLREHQKCIEDPKDPTKRKIRIMRIFVGRHRLADNNDEIRNYISVMREMKKYCIDCYYVQRDDPTRVPDMAWVKERNLLSVWRGKGAGVDSIDFTADNAHPDFDRSALEREWQALLGDATSYDDIASTSPQP